MLAKMLKRSRAKMFAGRHKPKDKTVLANIARNLQNKLFVTSLPTVKRRFL